MSCLLRTLVLCLVFCLPAGCDAPSTQLPEQSSGREYVPERFRVSPDSLLLLLPVEIQGRKYPFLLDTGTSFNVYDVSLRSFLGQPVQSTTVHTPNGVLMQTSYSPPAAKLGHFNLPTMSPVLCLDLGILRDNCEREIYGLLGMDFLGGHIVRIDFDRGEVTFLRSVLSDSGLRIPIVFHNSIPHVQVTIPGLRGQMAFQVDTGCAVIGDGDLRSDVFDSLVERGILKLRGVTRTATFSGSGTNNFGQLAAISLGHFRHKNLLFSRSPKVNSLGINHLSRYVVTFDFPNGAMYLKKGRQFGKGKGVGARRY